MKPSTAIGAAFVLALLADSLAAGCWVYYPQGVIGRCAPIIVLGEIVKIDTASEKGKEGNSLRYLDGASIKVEQVYKNVLSDVTVEKGREIVAFMHSTNHAVPGSERKDGSQVARQTSTDLRYPVGTRAVWFVFLTSDGKFAIHRHPQQRVAVKKGEKAPTSVPLGAIGETFSRKEWSKKDKSSLR